MKLALGNIETYGTAKAELPAVEIFCIAQVFYCGFTFFPFLTSTVSKINFPDLRVFRAARLKFHILLLWLFIFTMKYMKQDNEGSGNLPIDFYFKARNNN